MGFKNMGQWQQSVTLATQSSNRVTKEATQVLARYAKLKIQAQLPPGGKSNFPGYAATGLLKSLIVDQPVVSSGTTHSATVGLSPSAPKKVFQYAYAHEYGWSIRAKNAPYLVFQINGQWFKKKSVYIRPKHWFQDGWAAFTSGASAALETYVRSQWPPVK